MPSLYPNVIMIPPIYQQAQFVPVQRYLLLCLTDCNSNRAGPAPDCGRPQGLPLRVALPAVGASDQIIQGDVEIVGQGDQAIKIRPVFPRLIIVTAQRDTFKASPIACCDTPAFVRSFVSRSSKVAIFRSSLDMWSYSHYNEYRVILNKRRFYHV